MSKKNDAVSKKPDALKSAGLLSKSQIKSLKTRAKKQRAQAKAIEEAVKGVRSKEATAERARASHLRELARKNEEKAKEALPSLKAFESEAKQRRKKFEQERLGKDVSKEAYEQEKLEKQVLKNVTHTPQSSIEFEPPITINQAEIDTVLELATNGRGSAVLNTPVANAIRDWVETNVAQYGETLVAYVCMKALQENPYIFDEYIYDSDQTGYYVTSALITLDAYASEYIETYQRQNPTDEQAGLTQTDNIENIT